jgi:hypothetical protein
MLRQRATGRAVALLGVRLQRQVTDNQTSPPDWLAGVLGLSE